MLIIDERVAATIQNPATDKKVLFNDAADGLLKTKDSAGVVQTLATTEGLAAAALATEPKVYVALLTQAGVLAPVATVLKNTLGGTVVWSYNSSGDYTATLTGAFIENKTFLSLNNLNWDGFAGNYFKWATINTLNLFIAGGDDFLFAGGLQAAVKIEVYP